VTAVRPVDDPPLVLATTRGRSSAAEPDPAPGRRGLSARFQIMGWLVLLLTVALLTVVVVTNNLLLADVEEDVNAALVQERDEFLEFAAVGRNPETGTPFANAGELLTTHLARQRTAEDEVLVGVFADGTEPQVQGFSSRRAAITEEVLRSIVGAQAGQGELATPEGPMRWIRTTVDVDPDRVDGYFVVGELLAPRRGAVAETVQTMAVVSAAGLLLAAIASWIVSGQILAPVRLVRRTAEEITEDDLTRRIPVSGNDDIAALADRFNAMLDRLARAFGTQREFVDDAGHELRTPITIIRGHLELLDDDPAERARTVRLCLDELDRMARIVEDLLVLAKSERPDFVRPAPVELADLTVDVEAKVRALGDRQWVLDTVACGVVVVDAQRITQAVVQLAQNAVQHTGVRDTIHLGSALHDGILSFHVADNGPGVRPEDADSLFERFSRGSTGGAPTNRAGAGLGLAIVRAIAEAHGGWVRLRSVPGRGATFVLEVPAPAGPR